MVQAQKNHVLASAKQAMKHIGSELGQSKERVLSARLDQKCFFLGGIQKKKIGKHSIKKLCQYPIARRYNQIQTN